jgi:hypothetical protein
VDFNFFLRTCLNLVIPKTANAETDIATIEKETSGFFHRRLPIKNCLMQLLDLYRLTQI